MPRIVVTAAAARDMERCRLFLASKAPEAARRAGQAIEDKLLLLESTPHMGRPFEDMPGWRELSVPFGDGGYVALYCHEPADDAVYIIAFRHQKEVGY